MKKRSMLISLATFLMAFMPAVSAGAAPVARWDFNETTATHLDTSGNNLTANSGNEVQNGIATPQSGNTPASRGIRTVYVSDIMTALRPGRLTRVPVSNPNSNKLNPKTGNFSITLRFKNTQSYGNVLQKGQSATVGGYYKWEMPSGRLTCLFRDANKVDLVVKSSSTTSLKGAWHTVTCSIARGTNGTARAQMIVDGVVAQTTAYKTFGSISNNIDLTMMGKGNCNQTTTTCDYFAGDFDYLYIDN